MSLLEAAEDIAFKQGNPTGAIENWGNAKVFWKQVD
jgi:hypothetical protein